MRAWLARSAIRDRVRLVDLGDLKDPSGLYLDDPDGFSARWRAALAAAVPWTERAEADAAAEAAAAWDACQALAREPDILALAARTLAAAGVAGEARAVKLLYLILVSRFLPRPVSAGVKGPSSGGKSYLVERVLALFPPGAYHALTAMSERALAYSGEPLAHRHLVLYEAAGMAGDFASYLVRTLLSEGRIRYETVEKTRDGLKHRLIEREGPTGLLVTTTAVRLHPENETRMLSIPVTDTPEQTRAVLRALAAGTDEGLDPVPWHALQDWLARGEHRVAVPFSGALAELVPPVATRLRRDFGTVLTLVEAHALLHQATRERDAAGRVVAALADYAAVRGLVADLIAEGVEATVPATLRETVEAVRALADQRALVGRGRAGGEDDPGCSVAGIAARLGIDKSSASRRVKDAVARGHLKNLESGRGRPARIVLGDPLPDEVEVLPTAEALADRCTVAREAAGINTPPPPRRTRRPWKLGREDRGGDGGGRRRVLDLADVRSAIGDRHLRAVGGRPGLVRLAVGDRTAHGLGLAGLTREDGRPWDIDGLRGVTSSPPTRAHEDAQGHNATAFGVAGGAAGSPSRETTSTRLWPWFLLASVVELVVLYVGLRPTFVLARFGERITDWAWMAGFLLLPVLIVGWLWLILRATWRWLSKTHGRKTGGLITGGLVGGSIVPLLAVGPIVGRGLGNAPEKPTRTPAEIVATV